MFINVEFSRSLISNSSSSIYSFIHITSHPLSMLPIKLFAASYLGVITTLELSHSPSEGYSLESIASSKACTPAPSWLTLDSLRNTLYCTGVTATSTGLLHSLSIQENGTLVAIDETPTPNQAAYSAIYGRDQALGVAY